MTTTSGRLEDLTGKTALITGGSAGIGRASAILLAGEGARVAMNDVGIGYQDENGDIRAAVDADGIWYTDDNGTIRARMDDNGIRHRDETGRLRISMSDYGIYYWDEKEMRVSIESFGIGLRNENGNVVWRAPGR